MVRLGLGFGIGFGLGVKVRIQSDFDQATETYLLVFLNDGTSPFIFKHFKPGVFKCNL